MAGVAGVVVRVGGGVVFMIGALVVGAVVATGRMLGVGELVFRTGAAVLRAGAGECVDRVGDGEFANAEVTRCPPPPQATSAVINATVPATRARMGNPSRYSSRYTDAPRRGFDEPSEPGSRGGGVGVFREDACG